MSASTICHGCGQRLEIPADYARTKLRCPECGVMCDVAPQDERKPPQKQIARPRAPKPAAPTASQASEDDLPIKLAPEPSPLPKAEPEIEFSDDPEDGKPYRVTAKEPQCPQCGLRLEPGATQCPGCGWDLRTGKKPKRSFEPAELSWEAGMSLHHRRILFVLGFVLGIALGVPISIASESWAGGVISWIVFAVLGAFLLGTYPRVDLARSSRGKVTLTKTWRICFVERPQIPFDVLEFQAARTGYARDVSLIDWVIAILLLPVGLILGILLGNWIVGLVLLPVGLIPAGLWWYVFIERDQHTVTLVREHGYGSDVLYRGVSEKMAKDIARALEEIGGLPYENK
jgi:hypothetical protein